MSEKFKNDKIQTDNRPLLEIKNLSLSFLMYQKGYKRMQVISDLELSVRPGEILAVAGSSGSGKSLLAHAVLGILPQNAEVSGELLYRGEPLHSQRQQELRGREIALIPQSVTYLDPLMRIGAQTAGKDKIRRQRMAKAFERLGLPDKTEKLYPFQLSGGMARRVLFSTAVVSDAQLVIADEPMPGMQLDQAIEALTILRELADEGKGVVLITHDIDLAFQFADKIAVFYAGTTVEEATAADFISGPDALRHPYSKALWRALPQNDFTPIAGTQPAPGELPAGCLFEPRCPLKTAECREKIPKTRLLRGGKVRCIHAD